MFTRTSLVMVFSHWVVFSSLQPNGLQHTSPVLHHLLDFPQTQVHWVGDAIQPSPPLSSPSPPAFSVSQHQDLFLWVSSSHQVAKVRSFSFSVSPSNEHAGLISFRVDWFDILAVQGTLKVCSSAVLKHQIFSSQPSSYVPILTSLHDSAEKNPSANAGDMG